MEKYSDLEMEVIAFDVEDVILTSNNTNESSDIETPQLPIGGGK